VYIQKELANTYKKNQLKAIRKHELQSFRKSLRQINTDWERLGEGGIYSVLSF